ncbi:hypothetical protein [Streptomyces mangrovisoli]|uniref:Uncharacterized protein n=1 Tax=Streptomyces mangrovisoli TaxID=1428628 RepID=A0A1J4P126_9ACTN|nr:hypothetical protein [Streptomyces mangrovisoli]OIJ68463.1 hypothetical protein WN71_008600 [Streptomyces mangrovisoli]
MTGFPGAAAGAELADALNAELDEASPHRFAPTTTRRRGPVALDGDRSRVTVLTGNDAYVITFLKDAWAWAHGATQDKSALVRAAHAWLEGTGLEEMAARWPFVAFSELQSAYERGDERETQWRIVRHSDSTANSTAYRDVVELAAGNAVIRRFFPELGHGFAVRPHAFTRDILASVTVDRPGRYTFRVPGREELDVEGDGPAVVAVLAEFLNGLEG